MGNFLGFGCKDTDVHSKPLTQINKKRGCTDVPMLAFFIAWWVAVFIVVGVANSKGADPKRLTHGVDWQGNVCGGVGMEDKPFAAWPNVINPLYAKLLVCVKDCDATLAGTDVIPYPSKRFMFYCAPDPTVALPLAGAAGSVSAADFPGGNSTSTTGVTFNADTLASAMGDIENSYPLIFAAAAIAIVLGFCYSWFIKIFAGCLVWTCIVAVIFGTGLTGYTLLGRAQEVKADPVGDPNRAKAMEGLAYAVIALTAIFTLVILFLRNRIKIAIEVVKEASRAVNDMKSIIFFPFGPLAIGFGFFAWWIYGALVIFSVQTKIADGEMDPMTATLVTGTPTLNPVAYHQYEFDKSMQRGFLVHFFSLLWNIQFIIYFCYLSVAGAIADWYFTARDPESGNKIRGSGEGELGRAPIVSACWRAFRYHLGTIAFGSLIIAIIQFIRAMVKYIEEQGKNKNDKVRRAIFCLIQCCLKCLECCLDKINKNAYIFNAIYGDAFCKSAIDSFKLVWRNLARVAAISMVSGYLIILGKLMVAILTTGIIGVILTNAEPYKSALNSPIFPLLLTFFLAYMVGSLFMTVYETAVDTIFICFLVDEEQNKGGDMYAPKSLVKIVDKYADQSKAAAEQTKQGRNDPE